MVDSGVCVGAGIIGGHTHGEGGGFRETKQPRCARSKTGRRVDLSIVPAIPTVLVAKPAAENQPVAAPVACTFL